MVVHAMHPGWADTPAVASSIPGFHERMQKVLRTPQQGADTVIWLAAAADRPLKTQLPALASLCWQNPATHQKKMHKKVD